jgi:hypothetical protein
MHQHVSAVAESAGAVLLARNGKSMLGTSMISAIGGSFRQRSAAAQGRTLAGPALAVEVGSMMAHQPDLASPTPAGSPAAG